MSEDLLLKAERRTKVGSVDTRRLRDQGRVPANIYGLNKPGVSASVCRDAVSKLVSTLSSVVDVELDGTVDKAVVQAVRGRRIAWQFFKSPLPVVKGRHTRAVGD